MANSVAEYFAQRQDKMPQLVDLRGLEAPEPMETILLACLQLKADEYYLAHLPHEPTPLFPHLQARAMEWQVFEQADGSALVLIRRAA